MLTSTIRTIRTKTNAPPAAATGTSRDVSLASVEFKPAADMTVGCSIAVPVGLDVVGVEPEVVDDDPDVVGVEPEVVDVDPEVVDVDPEVVDVDPEPVDDDGGDWDDEVEDELGEVGVVSQFGGTPVDSVYCTR